MDEKSKIIDKAQKLAQKGYLDKAIAEYKKVTDRDPKDATIRLRIGDLYVKTAKKDEAIREYGEVAKIHTQKGFYLKAIAVYKQILKLDESLMDIHYKLSDLYTKQKLIADAVAELSILVNFYEKKAKSDEAIDILKKMTTVDPQNTGIRLKLAEYYKKKGFTNDALAEYVAACTNLIKEGKTDKAEKIYQELYSTHKKELSVVEGLAEICRVRGENERAVRYYKDLISLYKEKGDAEKQKAIYEKILAILPFDREAMEALGKKPPKVEEPPKVEAPPPLEVPPKVAAPPKATPPKTAPRPKQEQPAAEMPSPKAVPEETVSQEPLISWPEISVEITPEPEAAAPEQPSAPPQEEPLVPWSEMIETVQEAKPTEITEPQEIKETEPLEEAPVVEMPEIKVEEVAEVVEPALAEKEQEPPVVELKEVSPSEEEIKLEDLAEELTMESIELSEEFPGVGEASPAGGAEDIAAKTGLTGLEGFLPEGAKIMEVLESPPQEEYVDLSSELGIEEALDFLTGAWAPDAKGGEAFTEFKTGVQRQLSKEDSETHYNLGIAYMEMELYDDAMREFKIALKDPIFEFDCHNRLGLCFMAKGNYKEAIGNFLKGLKVSARTEEEKTGIMYELGLAYEAAGNTHEAVEIFKSVHETDKSFREVASKISRLTGGAAKEEPIPSKDDILEVELL